MCDYAGEAVTAREHILATLTATEAELYVALGGDPREVRAALAQRERQARAAAKDVACEWVANIRRRKVTA